MSMEVFSVADPLCYYAKNAEKFLATAQAQGARHSGSDETVAHRLQATGCGRLITPWNGPFVLVMNQAVQAMLAGNTVVAKGSEVTPYSARLAEDILAEPACPRVCCRCCWAMAKPARRSFAAVSIKCLLPAALPPAQRWPRASASQLIPCTLELGGNDAMIVCADADLDRAADGAWLGSCMNTGHYCCGTERIYVVAEVYDEFLQPDTGERARPAPGPAARLGRRCGRRILGPPDGYYRGPCGRRPSQGRQHPDGRAPQPGPAGLYYEPTVITEVNNTWTS